MKFWALVYCDYEWSIKPFDTLDEARKYTNETLGAALSDRKSSMVICGALVESSE